MRIADFIVLHPLGRGGFAAVFAARRAGDGALVALKLYAPEDERHGREVAAMQRVGPPVAPGLVAHGRDQGRPYLAMEQLDGPTFSSILATRPAPALAAAYLTALAEAVDHVHAAGVIHRDLKPAHVFVRGPGASAVTLIDFGLARLVDAEEPQAGSADDEAVELTREDERLGTAWYMAPEQCRGGAVDARADVYALGVIGFEMLTGARPFDGDAATVRAAHVAQRPPRASALAALPAAVDEVLLRCLAKDPRLRYERASEFARALTTALATALPAPAASAPPIAATTTEAAPAPRNEGVALVSLRFAGSALDLEQLLEPGENLAWVADGRYVVVVHGMASLSATVSTALRTATRLGHATAVSGAVVVHCAELRVRRTATGVRVRGNAADARLLAPPPEHAGVLLTRAAADALAPGTTTILDQDYAVLAGAGADLEVPLVGRAALLQELCDDARSAGICVVLGDSGLGKSRLLRELAARLEAAGHRVIALDGAHPAPLEALTRACAPGLPEDAAGRASELHGQRHQAAQALAAQLLQALAAAPRPTAILLDDAQRAEPQVLDTLEHLAETPGPAPVWIGAAALPALASVRPGWTSEAPRRRRLELAPLRDDDAHALLRQLMAPAEFIPAAVIDRLSSAAAGIPLYLVELVRALRAGGSLRAQDDTTGLFVAADELAHISTTPLAYRLAERLLAPLPAALRDCAALCAVAGDEVSLAHLDALQQAVGGAWLDPGVALARLAAAGLLDAVGATYRFRHPLMRRAIEALAAPRAEAWHRAALALFPAPEQASTSALLRLAEHASAAGARDLAWSAWFTLARRAHAHHGHIDAEHHYSQALTQLEPDDARQGPTLAGRGEVRYRIQRFTEALQDVRAARAFAEAAADTAETVRLLLQEATILDWIFDLPASAACAERASQLVAGLDSPSLHAGVAAAQGRSAYRQERLGDAIALLDQAARMAAAAGDGETQVQALLLLAPSLLYADQMSESEARYADVAELCERLGDGFHLAGTYINRQFLWMRLGRMDRAEEDLVRAIKLARSLGNALLERLASHNLGELLHWTGRDRDALPHARRSLALQRLFPGGHDMPDDSLLVARILAALGQRDEATALLDTIRARWPAPAMSAAARMLAALVELVLAAAPEPAWREAAAQHLGQLDVADFALELLHAAAEAALARGRPDQARQWLAEAAQVSTRSPLWAARLAALSGRCPAE